MPELGPGLYEALLTARLQSRLPASLDLAHLAKIEAADAPGVLASHVAGVIETALRAPGMEKDLARQIALCNALLAQLTGSDSRVHDLIDETVVDPGTQLMEISAPNSGLIATERRVRPTIPLSQNALLVAARQEPRLAAELIHELPSADRVDLLCAFVRWSGIRVLMDQLRDLRARSVPIRIITTTYTGSTELRALEELEAIGCQIKVSYETGSTRLHAKAWLLERATGYSTAYIGSSNLSHSALHDGLEWNVRLSQVASGTLLDRFRAAFETYWADPGFEDYRRDTFAHALERQQATFATELLPFDIQPYAFQREMLYQLEVERKRFGRWRNLVVAATGTGKTVVSAFDYKRIKEEWGRASLLFVAHRHEILTQSLTTFRNVLKDGNFGELMVGGERPSSGEHVFASIQSLDRMEIGRLAPDEYDVVIVDEFHHSEAASYRRLLDHLKPRLLLGMTATPERADGLDIKHWFDGRVAVELRLWDALDQGLLCPFQYFGVADGTNLAALPWSRGGYEAAALSNAYTADDARVGKVLRTISEIVENPKRMKALGFCVSVEHAQFMAQRFEAAGIPSAAVSASTSRNDRETALRRLRDGSIAALFAVDLFNEGLDIPEIDTVLFLRPTESPVVFLQQLGRGLRRTDGKSGLTVLDFIGQQHRRFRFEPRFKALLGGDRKNVLDQIEQGFPYLPSGCTITLDRQSTRTVIANIRSAVSGRRALLERLLELGDVSLQDFIDRADTPLEDIYASSTPGWTQLRREAGFVTTVDPDEATLSRAFSRMLHIDDPLRVSTYCTWLRAEQPPLIGGLSEADARLLAMLHFDVWSSASEPMSLEVSTARLWRNPTMRQELVDMLIVAGNRASRLSGPSYLEPEIPLSLHTRYTRNELLSALGEAQADRVPQWREGVKYLREYGMDVFAITLNKSEKRFSPSTRYRDYPISPSHFHWESQSTTSAASPTGQRYVNHKTQNSRILLFVRESDIGDGIGASPFLFLGTASYLSHVGERPMAITWRLDHEMPPDFFQAARAAV